MDLGRTDRVYVVTGGGRSIGLQTALALAEAGAHVVIIEPKEEMGKEGLDSLLAKGFKAELIVGDVTDSARMTEVADHLAARGTPSERAVRPRKPSPTSNGCG